jgi:thiol-disulfide isomerase/thioredoxin
MIIDNYNIIIIILILFIISVVLLFVLKNMKFFGNIIGGAEKKEDDCLKKHYETIRRRISMYNPQNKDNIIVQLHSTSWCPYCKKMLPIWNKLMEHVNNNPDFTNYTFLEQDQDECNAPGLESVPKIYKYVGNNLIKYSGHYDFDKLLDFVKKK